MLCTYLLTCFCEPDEYSLAIEAGGWLVDQVLSSSSGNAFVFTTMSK
jgi:hypothetical protein